MIIVNDDDVIHDDVVYLYYYDVYKSIIMFMVYILSLLVPNPQHGILLVLSLA